MSSAPRSRRALTLAAAGAAAATAASSQQAAHAAVIYTPANATVNAANPVYNIDFDGDSASDLSVDYDATAGLVLHKQTTNFPQYVAGTGTDTVKALAAGDLIDGTQVYNPMSSVGFPPVPFDGTLNDGAGNGEFTVAAGEQYIGVEFAPTSGTGSVAYGWIGFRVDDDSSLASLSATVTGYAYDDRGMPVDAGSTVPTPEPTSLGLLAMGATALAAYRRRTTR